jgi:hypothetical protein
LALLEDTNACAVCSRTVAGIPHSGARVLVPIYLCPACFAEWKEQLFAKTPWLMYLVNHEKQRRKRRNRILKSGPLPQMVSVYNGEVL